MEAVRFGGRGMEKALTWFDDQVRGEVVSWLRKIIPYKLDAATWESIYNDGFVAFTIGLREGVFRGQSSLKTYLGAICRNKAFDLIKPSLKQLPELELHDSNKFSAPSEEDRIENEQSWKEFESLVNQVIHNPIWVKILFLRMQGYNYADIAAETGLTVESCRNVHYKVIKCLHEYFLENPDVSQKFNKLLR